MLTLEEKVDLLISVVLHEDKISKIALSYGWNKEKVHKIYDIMDKYDQKIFNKENFTFGNIENDFKLIGLNYQVLKSILIAFYDNEQYIEVIKIYLKTNYEAMGNISSEYNRIYKELFL